MTLSAVAFAIYAAEGWPARINDSSSQGGETTSVKIAHADPLPDAVRVARPRIEVTTSIEAHQPSKLAIAIARAKFGGVAEAHGHRELGDDLSDAAVTLWFRVARRRRVSGAYGAPVGQTEIMIDGAAEPFVTVGSLDACWVAVRCHHDTITIVGREIDPASLVIEPIADPNARSPSGPRARRAVGLDQLPGRNRPANCCRFGSRLARSGSQHVSRPGATWPGGRPFGQVAPLRWRDCVSWSAA